MTRMTSSKAVINVRVTEYRTVKESWSKSYSLFKVETKSTLLNLYDPDRVYQVERRFNDFKQLHDQLSSNKDYEGFGIPLMPPDASSYSDYFMHSESFLTERQVALERYLQVVSTHEHMRFDVALQNFLTASDYKSSATPYLKKLQVAIRELPNISSILLDKDSAEAYMNYLKS